jgi:hypothetical protein
VDYLDVDMRGIVQPGTSLSLRVAVEEVSPALNAQGA